jgi:membrane protease YdiL (CAAX protease family)
MISMAVFSLVLAVVMQAVVGFAPVLTGRIIALLPAILFCALVNATVEEVVFRGFFQPAFMRAAGVGGGFWLAALLFGLVHWGIGVGVLAALPVSLMIAFGSVYWGKAAYETRGLSWTIAAHFMVDVAIMSAYLA